MFSMLKGKLVRACVSPCTDPEVGTGGPDTAPPTPEKSQNIGFLSNTGPDPLKNHKATKPAFQFWALIGTPAKRHLNGVSLAGRWWPADSGIFFGLNPLSPLKKHKKIIKTPVKFGSPLTKLSGPAHEVHCLYLITLKLSFLYGNTYQKYK